MDLTPEIVLHMLFVRCQTELERDQLISLGRNDPNSISPQHIRVQHHTAGFHGGFFVPFALSD